MKRKEPLVILFTLMAFLFDCGREIMCILINPKRCLWGAPITEVPAIMSTIGGCTGWLVVSFAGKKKDSLSVSIKVVTSRSVRASLYSIPQYWQNYTGEVLEPAITVIQRSIQVIHGRSAYPIQRKDEWKSEAPPGISA